MEKEKDLDLLVKKSQTIKLAGKEIIINEMSAGKAFEALEKWQKVQDEYNKDILEAKGADEKLEVAMMLSRLRKFQNNTLDVCLFIIKPENILDRFKYLYLNKRWLNKNANKEQLADFITIVLAPLIPENLKKKIKTAEAALKQ